MTEETEIDKKKEENSTSTSSSDKSIGTTIAGFIGTILGFIILILIILFSGSLLLFSCKVGQSNVLPTEKDCFPYTMNSLNLSEIDINANLSSVEKDIYSQKVKFLYEDNKTNKFLEYLTHMTEAPTQSGFVMYLLSIFKELFSLNYQVYNSFLNFINSSVSESFIIFFMPIVLFLSSPFILLGLFLMNYLFFYYYYFSKMSWLFKQNVNEDKKGKQDWKDITISQISSYSLASFLVFVLVILLIISFFVPVPIVGGLIAIILIYVIGTSMMMVGKNTSINKDYTFFSTLVDTTKYHQSTIMYIMTILVILTSFTKLGSIGGLCSLIIFIMFYYQLIPIPIYTSSKPENLSPLVSYEQAKKICEEIIEPPKKRSLLNKLTFGLIGGDHDLKRLKKIVK
jgi:hypothetical protein